MAHGNMIYDPDEMVRLYVDERLSLRMVAECIGCTLERVRQVLVDRGIPRRDRGVTRWANNYKGANQ